MIDGDNLKTNRFKATALRMKTTILAPRIFEKKIIYEHIENAKPDHYGELMLDLCHRTGLEVIKAEIEDMDFLRDTAMIKI